jgi:hypothetical protein
VLVLEGRISARLSAWKVHLFHGDIVLHIANILQIECICCCSEWIEPWNNYTDELEHPEVYDTALSKINMFNTCQDFMRQVGVNLAWMVCFFRYSGWSHCGRP